MEKENRTGLLCARASHAMWARDYKEASDLYTEYLKSEKRFDMLSLYGIHFNLAVLNAVLRNRDVANSHIEKLEQIFDKMERTRDTFRDRPDINIERIWGLMTRQADTERMSSLLMEYFPNEEDLLAFLISPRYARGFLRTAMRNAEMGGIPQVEEEGIFKYTLNSELYRVVGRAYSIQELPLENLHKAEPLKVLIENPNVYYVEEEDLRIIAAIQREGRILCQYSLGHSRDSAGAHKISVFLHSISETFSKQ